MGFAILCMVFTILFVCISMLSVYKAVWDVEDQSFKYSFARFRGQINHYKMSKRIKIQGILYALALVLTYIFPITYFITRLVTNRTREFPALVLLTIISYPLQGLFNMLTYLLPVYLKIYQRCKERKNEEKEKVELENIILANVKRNEEEIEQNEETGNGLVQQKSDGFNRDTN